MGNLKVSTIFLVLAVAVSIVHSAPQPQFITFKDGRLGVNFGGYHAGVGIGGSVDGGPAGGLFAEAGTPQGQSARAGLGGSVDPEHGPVGGLYASATAGGNVGAHAGLGGSVNGGKPIGQGFAEAEAGDRFASAGLGGETSAVGATGYKIKTKEIIRPTVHKKVHKEIILDSVNEVNPHIETEVKPEVHTPVIEKEVHVEKSPAPVVYEKHVVRYKPHHHFRKTAYVGGYVGGGAAPEVQEIHKTVHAPVIQKRIDVDHDSVPHSANVGYNKQIVFQRNPTFFSDIFNIPIQTLKAVGSFLGNTAASTSVSVQKSASVQAEPGITSSKHAPLSSSHSSTDAHVAVQTPSAGKFIDDIFAIPINTLGAVNKFLENNVPQRKKIDLGDGSFGRVRGPHRRRANKEVVFIKEGEELSDVTV